MADTSNQQLSETELCPPDLLKGQEEAFARDVARLQKRINEFVSVPCPACGHEQNSPAFDKHSFKYLSCDSCRTIYMSPRPSPPVMADYYSSSENYKYWADHIFPASQESRRSKINSPWLDRIVYYCDRFSIETEDRKSVV